MLETLRVISNYLRQSAAKVCIVQYNKSCRRCNSSFASLGPSTVYCSDCNKLRSKKTVSTGVQRVPCKINFVRYRAFIRHDSKLNDLGYYATQSKAEQAVSDFRAAIPKVSQGQWSKDNRTTTGIGYYMASRNRIRQERKHCNRCKANLLNVTRYGWCVHHIDHDRANNVDRNFELLCKSCHQVEHCKHDKNTGQYIQGSTTISEESTTQANGVGSGEKRKTRL